MVVQTRSTNKPVSGSLTLGVKNKQPIYISENDGRNNRAYLNSHPGEIIVLSEAEFAKWLTSEDNGQYTSLSSGGGPVLNDDETTNLYGTVDNTIAVPGMPSWNTSDIAYVSTDTGVVQNITITFESSASDPGDGSYTYHVHYYPGTATTANTVSNTTTPVVTGPTTVASVPVTGTGSSGSASTPQTVTASTNADVGTITTVSHTSSYFSISWSALQNVTSYTVTYTGLNIPGKPGITASHSCTVPANGGVSSNSSYASGSLSAGTYTFSLSGVSGYPFIGNYSISIQANYSSGSSTGVTYSVTI